MRTSIVSGAARRLSLAATLFLAGATLPLHAAQLLTPHVPTVVLAHAVPSVGAPDPATRMQLSISLPMRNQDAMDRMLHAIYDPSSPLYRHYLTVEEFTRRFGPTQHDYEKALRFFSARGLNVTATSANRYILDVNGSVAAIDRVFHVTMRLYRHPTENRNFVAPDREPTVDLDVPVLHVAGLTDYVLPTARHFSAPERTPAGGGSGPRGTYIGSDMRAAYYGNGSLTGAGQSVGLFEFEGYNPADITLYFKNVNQPLNVPVNGVSTDGKTAVNCGACNDGEQVLDIDYAISMAPGLSQVKVYVAKNADSILNAMATDTTVLQHSTSWGWREEFSVEDAIFKEMAMQGQTFLTASGDYSSLKASGPWPEEDANLTAVGGTDLVTEGAGGPYKSETAWRYSAGGPSVDDRITIPNYQVPFVNAQNMGSKTLRNVPDVALNSEENYYLCFKQKCIGGDGGTSYASPIWAGFVALANEQAAAHGDPAVGFLAKSLYLRSKKNAAYSKMFHDVIGGKSGKYTAVKGFDLVTGLGSPNGPAMIDGLAP